MNTKLTCALVPATLFAIVAIGFATNTGTVMAQQVAEEIDEIVVQAPIQRHQVGRSASTGAKIEIIELRRRVSYADLDLRKGSDISELETRIATVAEEACDKLAEMFPLSSTDRSERSRCVKDAIKGTHPQVKAAIGAVN